MRYQEIKLLSEKRLEELRQSPGALKKFVDSEAAQGMQAGFEAELIFPGLAGDGDGDLEPDYDEDVRADTLEEIIDFFTDGPYGDISRQDIQNIRESIYEDYSEWIQGKVDQDWDQGILEHYIENHGEFDIDGARAEAEEMVDSGKYKPDVEVDRDMAIQELVAEQLDQFVNEVWEAGFDHNIYQNAYDDLVQETEDNYDLDDFVSSERWYMSDIAERFSLSWPYMIDTGSEEGYNEYNAEQLADDLSRELGVRTKASGGYHSTRRDSETWIFEPDSSLDPDDPQDMAVEIISPPMPLSQAIEILPKFFAWAKSNNAYSNRSTGFHMSVSMPDHDLNKLDYTKLALLLGDQYVLKQFGRSVNQYARSALDKIRDQAHSPDVASQAMEKMREHMGQFAGQLLSRSTGFGKYVSINPKDKYVEFRGAGGTEYMEDLNRLQNTLMRYAQALSSAMDPEADKTEYARKLYKLLSGTETQQVTDPRTGRKRVQVKPSEQNVDSLWMFSRYASGELNKSELVDMLRRMQKSRKGQTDEPAQDDDVEQELGIQQRYVLPRRDPNGNFEIFDRRDQSSEYRFTAANANDALAVLELYRARFNEVYGFDPARYGARAVMQSDQSSEIPANTDNGNYEIYHIMNGHRLLRFQADSESQAREVHDNWIENVRPSMSIPAGMVGLRSVASSDRNDSEMPENTDDGNYEIASISSGNRFWKFNADNDAQAMRAYNYWLSNIKHPSVPADNVSLRWVGDATDNTDDDEDEDRVLPFLVTYSLGHDGARSGYRVNARSADEARRVFVAQVRDQGHINMNRLYTWDVEQLR